MAESSAQAERNALVPMAKATLLGIFDSNDSWPLTSIPILEFSNDYQRWNQNIHDWLEFNDLYPFTEVTKLQASRVIRNRLGDRGRELIEKVSGDPQTMLDIIATNYKPKGSVYYANLVRQLLGITFDMAGGVHQHEKAFRKVIAEIDDLDSALSLPEPFLTQLFLQGLGDSFAVFLSIYTQTHELYGDNAITFNEVVRAVVNAELCMRTRLAHDLRTASQELRHRHVRRARRSPQHRRQNPYQAQ